MARIKIEEVIGYLDQDIRKALKETIDSMIPDNKVDAHGLFQEFQRRIARRCNTWVSVPDNCIDKD